MGTESAHGVVRKREFGWE